MTKKSNAVQKAEDSSPVLEGELIDEESAISEQPEILKPGDKPSPAFTLGKMAGAVCAFLIGFFQNRTAGSLSKRTGCPGRGRRLKSRKRIQRRR